MDSEIQNFGSYLKDCLNENDEKGTIKLLKYVGNYLADNVEANVLNYLVSKIFDDSYNLLKFLIDISDKGWKLAMTNGFELLNHFWKNFREYIQQYTLEITKVCEHVSTSKATAFEKTKALDILSVILSGTNDLSHDDIKNIYDKFYKFCGVHQAKTSVTLQKHVFVLLGIITKKYPFLVSNSIKLIDTYIDQIQRQSESKEKNRDKNILSGCVEGLSDILESFPIDNNEIKTKVYRIIKKLLVTGSDSNTYDIRAVVRFVSKHCTMLAENIYNDAPKLWHDTIKKWVLKSADDNRKAGYMALEVFYTELANVLKTQTAKKDKEIFEYFYNYFLQTMKDETADIIQIRLAIRGFGAFAAPCEVHMTKQNLSKMFVIIVNRMEQDYFIKDSPSIEQLEYLPDYMHCFSTILHQIGDYSFDQIESLQQISILMIKTFPKLSSLYYYSVYQSFILTMCYLHQCNPKSFEKYLQRVIYQGVLWTCSHRTTFDVDLYKNDEDTTKLITYKDYLPLWRSVFDFVNSSNTKYDNFSIPARKAVVNIFYNELIKTLLLLINKLNLNTTSIEDAPIVDPTLLCEAEKLDDYIIFINIVDFYIDLLSSKDNEYFRKWIKMFCNQIIIKSYKYPFVSGFYKLLKLALQICDKLDYFEETELGNDDRKIIYKTICSFLERVLYKIEEFKDDLQVSCIQLLLNIPIVFVQPLLGLMGPVFNMAFTVGRGYLKLAENAVDTLDKWYEILPKEELNPLLKIVLPHFDTFLRSKGFSGDTDIKLTLLQARKSKRRSSKRKVIIENSGELVNLQHKILMFIGQLSSELCVYMVESNIQVEQVTWDKEPHLKFVLPYNEVKPNIYLDRLIPRVIDLALTSGDQKTRVTASELFHSIVIFMIGTSRQMSPTKQKQLNGLFKKVMPPILQLGCDSNDVIKQLFNPLLFQIIHWYSSPMQLMSSETSILIDILMDGISHPCNTAVRDLSGKGIKEFVKWTIKQYKEEDLQKNSQNIHAIVNRLCVYSVHPNFFKRLGAALAFNQIYTILREEESMVDIYWLELFYSLMINMSLTDIKQSNIITQLDSALNHIERVLKEKRNLFNSKKYNLTRRVPTALEGPTMKDIVNWILHQTTSLNLIYRRKSIKLFCSLATYVDDCGTTKNFINKFVEIENNKWFIKYYESDGIEEKPTFASWETFGSVENITKWFQYLLRCLDSYKFLLDYKIIEYCKIINSSKIHESINYFIENISEQKLNDALKLFKRYDKDYVIMPDEIESFTEQKCEIVLGIFNYIISAIDKCVTWCEKICNKHFWKFLCNCVYQPNTLGFDLNKTEFGNKIIELLNIFAKKLPELYLNELNDYLYQYFVLKYNEVPLNVENIPLSTRNLLKGWLLLQKCEFKKKHPDTFSNIDNIFVSIIRKNDHKTVGIELQGTILEYAELQLEISFCFPDKIEKLCNYLINNTKLTHPETNTTTTHGEYFLNLFKDIIMEYILQHINQVIKILCGKWINFENNSPLVILINILKYLDDNIHLKKQLNCSEITETILQNISHVFTSLPENSLKHRNFQIELMAHIIRIDYKRTYIIGNRFEFFKIWFINQLKYNPNYEVPKNILLYKTNVLSFLHCVTGSEDEDDDILKSALASFLSNIANSSYDILDESDRIVLFKKFLDYLMISKSRIVLQTVLETFNLIKYNENNINIHKTLQIYILSISPEQQYKSLRVTYNMCFNSSFDSDTRYNFAKIFMMSMLRFCSNKGFEDFFIENIKEVINNLKVKITNESDLNAVVNKSINLIFIEALFLRINIEGFVDKTCPISKAVYNTLKTGKELIIECISIIRSIRKENLQFEDKNMKERYRLYQCDALNSLISIISNSKKSNSDIDIYCYIFLEDKNKGEIIWEKIIDCNKQIEIPQDFNNLPIRKKILINIRNENQNKQENKPIKYIESQSLFNSTLSEDVCKFDFTNSLVRNADFEKNQLNNSDIVISSFDVESVDINNHECMATICGLIYHLVDNKISPLPTDIPNAELPKWLNMLRKIFFEETTRPNVKIFFARVIHNVKFIFKYYAKFFFEPIVKLIVDKQIGQGINYFVADLVEMLISWSDNLDLTEMSTPISELISFLIKNVHNDRLDMLKYNLEIIKTSIEKWESVITIPYEAIYNLLNSNPNLASIHITGIFIANNLPPWTNNNIDEFIKKIITILQKEDKKVIYKPAAEVIGMILSYISKDETLKDSFKKLSVNLETVINGFKTDKMFHSLEQLQIHYPEIIDKYIRKICMKMYCEADSGLKAICLKNILRRFDTIEITPLTSKDLIDLLNIDDNDVRILTLQIVKKSVEIFKKQHLLSVLNCVVELKSDSNSMVRCAVYEVLITVYKKYINDIDAESKDLIKVCKPVLLSAIVDTDLELQENILNFWCNDRYYNLKLTERFEKSLTDLYCPETELYYLGCVDYFLLEACKNTPEYNKLMFEHPLSECEFYEYQLLINWRAQNASMAPKFANTFVSNTMKLDNAVPQIIGVRASNSVKAFTPTVSSLDLSASLNSTSSLFTSNISSNVISSSNNLSDNAIDIERSKYKPHGRRFLQKSKISLGFAKYETEKKNIFEQQRRERMKRKEANVIMYRKYRKGELPDVQIPNSAVIKPLQILARRDGILARQLYVMLFNSLINEMEDSETFLKNYNNGILSLFTETNMYVPNVIRAILDVSFVNNKKKNTTKIHIDPDILSSVCKNSGLIPVGCLLLEEYINLKEDFDEPSTSKRGCGTNDETNYWVKLADLYKELNEWDTVIGIFSSKHMDCSEKVTNAIQSEADGRWRAALSDYNELLQTDTNFSRRDFYYESYYKCFANLSEWDKISESVIQFTDNSLWDGDFNQDKLLPWYMMANMCSVLEGNAKNTFLDNLNIWMKDKDKTEYLKDKFSEELSILALVQNDKNTSKHYIQNSFSKFLEDWSNQNPLFNKLRSNKILNFQKAIDVNKFLSNKEENSVELMNYFQKNCNLTSFSMITTELRTLYRQQLLKSLGQILIEHGLGLKELELSNDLNLINDSLLRNNYFVARKYCKKNRQYVNSEENKVASFKLAIAMSKAGTLVAETATGSEKITKLIESWKLLGTKMKKYPNEYIDLQIESSLHIFNISHNIFNILNINTNKSLLDKFQKTITQLIASDIDCLTDLKNYSINTLRSAIILGENYIPNSNNVKVLNNLMETYMKFIIFLQNEEENEMYHPDIVKYVLRAMKVGSRDARQLFPCLLDLPDLNNSLLDLFKEESATVPTWIFILWIPQLLACLNTININAVADIILRLADDYPHALLYSYRITRENFDLSTGEKFFQEIILRLDKTLHSDLLNKFLNELSCICIPELYLNYHLDKLLNYIHDIPKLKEMIVKVKKDIINKISSSKEFNSIKRSLEKIENTVNDTNDSNVIKQSITNAYQKNSDTAKSIKSSRFSKLKTCSSWLANFKASDWTTELEIPGQYSGESKPIVKYHAKILSFNSNITMINSLRKPFKLIVYGNDAKEYAFLVKFGEDLRQDQRIQQLFSLANSILHSDQQCQQRNLNIEQYQVIPLTTSLGLIKMIENVSLRHFIYGTADDQKLYGNVRFEYLKWIGTSGNPADYYRSVVSYSKDETNMMFTRMVNTIPANILSKAFWGISMDTESYIFLRHQFITSYSTMCLIHWICGIGDRHLDNCLIIPNNGRAVGIDFGCAFGTSTQHLPIPELIPFRLSPHILYLMEPLQEIGFIEHTMIHVLRALRKQKHILLSTMNIFIKEPSVDWLKLAKSQENTDLADWHPNQKIGLVMKKLEGANPSAITIEELMQNKKITNNPEVFKAYISIAKGDESNFRANAPKDDLTVEKQVKCLLDQATDNDILGRMYHGLELWI